MVRLKMLQYLERYSLACFAASKLRPPACMNRSDMAEQLIHKQLSVSTKEAEKWWHENGKSMVSLVGESVPLCGEGMELPIMSVSYFAHNACSLRTSGSVEQELGWLKRGVDQHPYMVISSHTASP